MNFNSHLELEGRHAFLSASKYHWLRYDDEKLANSYRTAVMAQKGTELHDLAATLIRMGVRLPQTRQTLNKYVNDAIGFRMTPEQPLFYSRNAFGTADAISFRKNFLRIHDLKTGVNPAKFDQLLIYAAFFCLEYEIKPSTIKVELRLYQNDDVSVHIPELDELVHTMDRVVSANKVVEAMRQEEYE